MESITWEDYQKSDGVHGLPSFRELTNIKCPACNKYIYRITNVVLTTYPPQYRYECDCGWSGVGF